MSRSFLWAGLAAAALAGGCARNARIDEAQLGQIPVEQKQAIFTAQHNVTVAEANKQAAERARDEAQLFRDVADKELNAAKEHVRAARQALSLAERQPVSGRVSEARAGEDTATKEVMASRAKLDYADKLVDLRKQQVDLAGARVDAARADLSFVQADTLQRNNIQPGVDIGEVERARTDASNRVVDEERKAATIRDQLGQLRTVWRERRHAFDVASRNAPAMPETNPPPPAKMLPAAPIDRDNRLMEPTQF